MFGSYLVCQHQPIVLGLPQYSADGHQPRDNLLLTSTLFLNSEEWYK